MRNKVNSSKEKKNKLLALAFACVVAGSMTAVACDGEEPPKPVYRDEAGVYYCIVDGVEYQVALSEGMATLVFGDVTSATYVYEGDDIVMTGANGPINVSLKGNVLTVVVDGQSYTCLKKVNYTVTFDSNGGSAVPAVKVVNGMTVAQPAAPVKEGYDFVAWYTDSQYKNVFTFDSDVVTEDVTLYAYYVEKSASVNDYTVTFDTMGGNEIASKPTVGGKLYSLPVAEKEGAEFIGWWYSDLNDANKLTAKYDGQTLTANTTLFAVYKSDVPAVSVTGTKIEWNSVSVGASYSVVITDANGGVDTPAPTSSTSIDYNFANKEPGLYKVEVKVNGKTATAYYANKTLARVSKFSVIQPGILLYNAVEGATQYIITVDCGDDDHKHVEFNNGAFTSFNFSNCPMQEGGIKFTVKATANGYASSVSDTFVYCNDLDAIDYVEYDDATGTVTWATVDNAVYYKVEVVNGDEADAYTVFGNEFSLEGYNGNLTVKVTPVANGYNSPEAATVTCAINRLNAPANVKQSSSNAGEIASWDAVEGAVAYKVKMGSEIIDTTNLSVAIPETLLVAGSTYELSVMAVAANEAENSLWSAPITVTYQKLTDVNYANGIVTWNAVAGARAYGVSINNGEKEYTIDDGANYVAVDFDKAGENTIEVVFYDFYFTELGSITMTVNVHELTFDAQGGEAVDSMFVVSGDAIKLPTTTRAGRVFEGWYNVPGGPKNNGAKYDYDFFNANASTVLYAYWTSMPEDVKLTVNETAGSFGNDVYEMNYTVYYDEHYTLPVPTAKISSDVFDGWYDADGKAYTDGNGNSLAPWTGMEEKVLYAQFASAYDLTLIDDASLGKGYRVTGTAVTNNLTVLEIPAYHYDAATDTSYPVIEIAAGAFYYCDNVQKIMIPETVQRINFGAGGPAAIASSFQFCSSLKEIVVYCPDADAHNTHDVVFKDDGNGVLLRRNGGTEEADYTYDIAFVPNAITGTYEVPACVNNIPANTFNLSRLSKVIVPATVATVGNSAFAASSIVEVEFKNASANTPATTADSAPELTFGSRVFANSTVLDKVTLPAKTIKFATEGFDSAIFAGCNLLTKVVVDGVGGNYTSNNGMLCNDLGTELLYCPAGFAGDANGAYVIPNVIEKINDGAFKDCRKLKDITINEFVTYIGQSAFENCVMLEKVTFMGKKYEDSKALTIEKYAFNNCVALTSIEIPANTKAVKQYAFANTKKLKTVVLASTYNASYEQGAFSNGTVSYVETVELKSSVNVLIDVVNVFYKAEIKQFKVDANNSTYYADDNGFLYNKNVTSLIFAPYIEIGGENGLAYEIPASVTKIETGAFSGRSELYSIVIPATVNEIAANAFTGSGLTAVTFAPRTNALTIGASAFQGCAGLTAVDLIDNVTSVGANAFKDCTSLNDIKISKTIVSGFNPASVFAGCPNIETINVDSANTAFASLNNVVYGKADGKPNVLYLAANKAGEITIPASVTEVSANAFANTTGITKITFQHTGATPISIGTGAFQNAVGLTEVTLPEGLEKIAENMFDGCTEIVKIVIPTTVTWVGPSAFKDCHSLSQLVFTPGGTAPLVFEGGRFINPNNKQLAQNSANRVFYNCYSLEEVVFPERTTRLGAYLFNNETGIKKVVIPSTVERIGGVDIEKTYGLSYFGYVFSGCPNLTEVIFAVNSEEYNPNGTLVSKLTHIDSNAFSMSGITSIKIPDTVTFFGTQMFQTCPDLVEAWLPASLDGLYYQNQNATTGKLTNTECSSTFANCSSLTTVHIPSTYRSIGMSTFQSCISLKNVTIPNYNSALSGIVNGNATSQFRGCVSLTSIVIPDKVTKIPNMAFYESGLTSINIPANVTAIGNSAFIGTPLTSVTFAPESKLTTIGTSAFEGTLITTVELPSKVSSVGTLAFGNCPNLTTVSFPTNVKAYSRILEGSDNVTTVNFAGTTFTFDATNRTVIQSSNGNLMGVLRDEDDSTGIVVIPDGIKVIGAQAFRGFNWVKKVIIPATVTEIGQEAFYNCNNLDEIVFQTDADGNYGIKKIGNSAFSAENKEGKGSVKKITIPNSVTTLGTKLFYMNKSLEEVKWDSTLAVPDYCFYSCERLDSFDFSKTTGLGNTALGGTAIETANITSNVALPTKASVFSGCKQLKSVTLPDSWKGNLPNHTFSNCSELTTVKLPAGIVGLGQQCFNGCTKLKSINTGNIADYGLNAAGFVFQNCTSLEEIDLKYDAMIRSNTFKGCSALKTINMVGTKGGTMAIEDYAFQGCSALEEVNFPDAVALHTSMFADCTSLRVVYMPKASTIHKLSETNLNKDMFKGCTALEHVTLGNLTTIPANMFKGCTNLSYFNLSPVVTSIGANAFESAALTEIKFPTTLSSIGAKAFYGNDFTTVEIPATVTSIGEGAFSGCEKLEKIAVDNRNGYYVSANDAAATNKALADALYDMATGELISYPGAKEVDGKIIDLTDIDFPIGKYAFAGLQTVNAVKLPAYMTEVPEGMLKDSSIRALEIKGNVTKIGDYAFSGCDKLVNLAIADTVTSMGKYAFYNCTMLEDVTLPKGLTAISDYAFTNTAIDKLVIPGNVTAIGKHAFEGTKITSLVIPDSVKNIKEYSFNNVTTLKEVTFNANTVFMGKRAFANTGLVSIVLPASSSSALADKTNYGGMGSGSIGDTETQNALGYVFADCKSLKSVEIIGYSKPMCYEYMFDGCTALETFKVSGDWATGIFPAGYFRGCTALKSVFIPATVTNVKVGTFDGWTADQTIYVELSEEVANSIYAEGWSGNATVVYDYKPQ